MEDPQGDPHPSKSPPRKHPRRGALKHTANWLVLIFGGLYFCFHVGFVIWHAVHNQEWLLDQVRSHYASIIGLPFAAYASVCLVLFLESRYDDPIEFKALGFEFKGASGPIILWAICFLIIAICMKLLWNA